MGIALHCPSRENDLNLTRFSFLPIVHADTEREPGIRISVSRKGNPYDYAACEPEGLPQADC